MRNIIVTRAHNLHLFEMCAIFIIYFTIQEYATFNGKTSLRWPERMLPFIIHIKHFEVFAYLSFNVCN